MSNDERLTPQCNKCDCDLCSNVIVDPIDIEKHGAKLLTARIQVNGVCFGKAVAVACIIYDNCHRILAFRGFTTVLCREEGCSNSACGTITRKLIFVLPDEVQDPDDLDIRCVANYIYPCETPS